MKTASDACRGSKQEVASEARQIVSMLVYLRAAQAYMLISMPTSTSTIFGVFQVIGVSQALLRRDVHAGMKGKAALHVTQAFHINVVRCSDLQRYFLTSWNNWIRQISDALRR